MPTAPSFLTHPPLSHCRCHYAEEEKRILMDVGEEMTEELKSARKTLENTLKELETSLNEAEAQKRKIEKLEEDNKRFVSGLRIMRTIMMLMMIML